MYKSFGYDGENNRFRIARHQIGDFGLHLSLIRSFSLGDNFPVESPFFPGKPLPYHYYFDLLTGFLERAGLRIDIAFNGLSILFFTALLYLIYKLPQIIFLKNRLLGILSVLLFIFESNLTFIDFFKEKGISFSVFKDLWYMPDYIHKGPFDGSIISIFFTMNVYLNQRHLIAAFVISLAIFYSLIPKLLNREDISVKRLILLGFFLGILSRFHSLTFFATALSLLFLFILFKRIRLILPLFLTAGFIFIFHLKTVLGQDSHSFFNPGFLSSKPLSIFNLLSFWFFNLGLAFILIPFGFIVSRKPQKLILLSVLPLFLIGNIFQLSYRIDHNHSLFNFFLIFANFYIAYFLIKILEIKNLLGKFIFTILLFFLTVSGVIDLMAVKNDFQFYFPDAPSNKFMQWIRVNTKKDDIFLSKQEILDPVTLSGRKNYMGHDYYLSVMGYNYSERLGRVKSYFEAKSLKAIDEMKSSGISYLVVPLGKVTDFNYKIDTAFLNKTLKVVYKDKDVAVYKL